MTRDASPKLYSAAGMTAATGTNGDLATLLDMVFKQMNTMSGSTHGTATKYNCNEFDVKYAADGTKAAEKVVLDNEGYTAAHDTLWTEKGCGFDKKDTDTGGATAKFVSAGLATVVMTVAAALM